MLMIFLVISHVSDSIQALGMPKQFLMSDIRPYY